MYSQATPPSLEWADLKWEVDAENGASYSNLVECIPPSRRSDLKTLTITLNSSREAAMLNSLGAFNQLSLLTLYNDHERKYPQKPWYTLQGVLDQLQAPSLRFLAIESVLDWRIEWRETFRREQAFPSLLGVSLLTEWADSVMWGEEAPDEYENPFGPFPPSTRMWNTVLTFFIHGIGFDITLESGDSPFLNYAPSFAAKNRLDLATVGIIHHHVVSRLYVSHINDSDNFDINVGIIPLADLTTILQAMKLTEILLKPMDLSLQLPYDTTLSIAQFLPHNIVELSITVPGPNEGSVLATTPASELILDPTVIPACIVALPNLTALNVYLKLFGADFQPMNSCTVTRCSLPSLPLVGAIDDVVLKISRSDDPVWEIHFRGEGEVLVDHRGNRYYIHQPNIQPYDPGDEVIHFEREIRNWFQLSTSLECVEVDFERMKRPWPLV
jgi:hypothetical protein